MALVKNAQGQISIFFSASLVVLITIVAFVINIGLFVKAKINLQNATDAAAFAGASVQARQLTTMGYLNWEMRNIYKEWMFKYWVIGNLNIRDVENFQSQGPTMNFRLQADYDPIKDFTFPDNFNIPAVCIHVEGSKTNICRRYSVPGLPEFGSSNLPGAEEASRAFMDALIGTKAVDCSNRTAFNMYVANTWAYNVLTDNNVDETMTGRGPAILANRQGAWPQAVEVAMRMRNLEYAMNRPPVREGVCIQKGSPGQIQCGLGIDEVIAEKRLGNERLVKAFYSGYRNLGNNTDDEMKNSFTLTELPPKAADLGGETSASYLLVPTTKRYEKHYVDLRLMMVNFATFYAAMITRGDSDTSGACDVSKVAIPVPGYPLGFYKNPDLLTYYAVRGEAEFIGMFNPFGGDPVKLTTYSAAKPFGGRIGPMLFHQKPGADFFLGRNDPGKRRSVPYLTSLSFEGTQVRKTSTSTGKLVIATLGMGDYAPGAPLPVNFDGNQGHFWLRDSDQPIGGKVTDGTVQFGIPNLVYDYQVAYQNTGYSLESERIHKIQTADSGTDKPVGLYSKEQFKMFKGDRLGQSVTTPELMEEEIARVRAPTLYETANYLIPSPNEFNISKSLDSFGFIPGKGTPLPGGIKQYEAFVYAPLYSGDQQDVLWQTSAQVVSTIFDFMRAQRSGIDKYRRALNQAAMKIHETGQILANTNSPAAGSAPGYTKAAEGISDINFSQTTNLDQPVGSCKSIAGNFLHFYYGHQFLFPGQYVADTTGCPVTLGEQLQTYFNQAGANSGFSSTHYRMQFSWTENFPKSPHAPEKSMAVFSGYMPGRFTGIEDGGEFINPITGEQGELMRRNFYSTKFVTLDSLQGGAGYDQSVTNFVIYSEGDLESGSASDKKQNSYKNGLDAEAVGVDLSSIKY